MDNSTTGLGHVMRVEVDAKAWRLFPDLRELAAYRDLFITLSYRDIRVRYAQTALGFAWAFFQPLATLLVLSLIFGRAMDVDTQGIPYPLFAVTGISAWSYFSFVLKESGGSIIGSQEIVRKIYFPRLIIPLSKATVGLVDLVVALLVMIAMFFIYGLTPQKGIVLTVLFLLGIMVAAVGVGIWVSALTIKFRDLQHAIPFLIQFGLFITPVAYPASSVTSSIPPWATVLYYMNPMAGIIEGYRWSILGIGGVHGLAWLSFGMAIIFFVTGLIYFRKVERYLADLV